MDPLALAARVHLPTVEMVNLTCSEDLAEQVETGSPRVLARTIRHRLANRVSIADERPQARVAGQDAQLGAARDELQIGTLLEPDGLGLLAARVCHHCFPRSGSA